MLGKRGVSGTPRVRGFFSLLIRDPPARTSSGIGPALAKTRSVQTARGRSFTRIILNGGISLFRINRSFEVMH